MLSSSLCRTQDYNVNCVKIWLVYCTSGFTELRIVKQT